MINNTTWLFKTSFLVVSLISNIGYCQSIDHKCKTVRNGHFYSYFKKDSTWSEIFRKGDVQLEVNRITNDTMIYSVDWLTPCSFYFKYVRSTLKFEPGQESFNKSFKTFIELQYVGEYFYTYKATMSSHLYPKQMIVEDTIWRKRMEDKELYSK